VPLTLTSKLPAGGVSIFATMTRLANELGAINLSQGFPDFDCAPELIEAVTRYMRAGHNQYAPMPGVLALREAIAAKVEQLYGPRFDPATEVVVTSGATAGLYATLTTFVQPGEPQRAQKPGTAPGGLGPRFAELAEQCGLEVDIDAAQRGVDAHVRNLSLIAQYRRTAFYRCGNIATGFETKSHQNRKTRFIQPISSFCAEF